MNACEKHPEDVGDGGRWWYGCIACLLSPGGSLNLLGHPSSELAGIVQTIAWLKNWDITTIRLLVPLSWAENVYCADPRARMEQRDGRATLVIPMQIGDLCAVVERRDDVLVERNGDRLFTVRFE